MLKQAYDLGVKLALRDAGLIKEADFTHGVFGHNDDESILATMGRNAASNLSGLGVGGGVGVGAHLGAKKLLAERLAHIGNPKLRLAAEIAALYGIPAAAGLTAGTGTALGINHALGGHASMFSGGGQ
jgi:hypothetical protein